MKLTFPHMGNLWLVAQTLFESLGIDVVVAPENSKRTLDLGTKLSPESACLPLKLNLGNFMEAAEKGAEVLITGNLGPKAHKVLSVGNIKIYTSENLPVKDAINAFLNKKLEELTNPNVEGHWK